MNMQYWTKEELKKEKTIPELYIQIGKADQYFFSFVGGRGRWATGHSTFMTKKTECVQGV